MSCSNWKRNEDENGFSYYINESTNVRQWDHSKFSEIKQRLDDCNYIKYASYRVASKFRVLQNALHMDDVPLSIISGVFERHRLGTTENTLCLESYDVEAVLCDIYFAANKQIHLNIDIDFATELMINFLYNIYDRDRKTNIQVVSTKLVLAVLCNSKLIDVYRYIFQLCADHNNCVTRFRLQGLLSKLCDITNYLNENINYGKNLIAATIELCFHNSPGMVGINETNFISWMESGPDFFSWLPILHRLKYSETVIHSAKCSVCRLTPMIGLRYRCIKCTRYIQCQQCFLTGRVSNSHKLSHPMKEYFSETSTKEFAFGLLRKLCGTIKCTNDLNISKVVDVKPLCTEKELSLNTTPTDLISNIEPLSSPMAQLQVIIRQLELQNRELQQIIVIGNKGEVELKSHLEQHRKQVASQIHNLKILKDYLKSSPPPYIPTVQSYQTFKNPKPYQNQFSTPMISDKTPRFNVDLFSPITFKNNLTKLEEVTERTDTNDDAAAVEENVRMKDDFTRDGNNCTEMSYTMADISSWIGGPPGLNSYTTLAKSIENKPKPHENLSENGQTDLDEALAKLQQILANNLVLDESLGSVDNGQLKCAVTEVEGMLTTIIDNVESSEMAKYKNNFNKRY